MVTTHARWVLTHTNVDPLMVAQVWGIHENECWQYLDEVDQSLRSVERNPQAVQKEVREWVTTIPNAKNIRIDVIKEKLNLAKTNPEKYDVEKLLFEVALLRGDVKQITPQDVERAKAHPIENLLRDPVRNNMTLCPLHGERTPSCSVKNNKFKCFGCGERGDVIDLYRKLNNADFITAVKALQ